MLKYIIRLDDACPNMIQDKWDKIEKLLDKYKIKPIVGVIPDNLDPEFNNKEIDDFWNKYPVRWQKKGWIIAQHGLNHNLSKTIRTEYAGKSYEEQLDNLKRGYELLSDKNIKPDCFFAPAHTFDKNTVKACLDLGFYKFISDGYAFYPYRSNNMMFLPCCFDTPYKISKFGVFTFVYHPNKTNDNDLVYLENFIIANLEKFDLDIIETILGFSKRKKNFLDYALELTIFVFRKIRKIVGGNQDE